MTDFLRERCTGDPVVPMTELQNRWLDLVREVARINPHAADVVASYRLASIDGNQLLLVTNNYQFFERLADDSHKRKIIAKAIENIFNVAVFVDVGYTGSAPIASIMADESVAAAWNRAMGDPITPLRIVKPMEDLETYDEAAPVTSSDWDALVNRTVSAGAVQMLNYPPGSAPEALIARYQRDGKSNAWILTRLQEAVAYVEFGQVLAAQGLAPTLYAAWVVLVTTLFPDLPPNTRDAMSEGVLGLLAVVERAVTRLVGEEPPIHFGWDDLRKLIENEAVRYRELNVIDEPIPGIRQDIIESPEPLAAHRTPAGQEPHLHGYEMGSLTIYTNGSYIARGGLTTREALTLMERTANRIKRVFDVMELPSLSVDQPGDPDYIPF